MSNSVADRAAIKHELLAGPRGGFSLSADNEIGDHKQCQLEKLFHTATNRPKPLMIYVVCLTTLLARLITA